MRMKDKVLQLVTDGARVLSAQAVIRNVTLWKGTMRGLYEGREVVSISRGVWQVVGG